MQSIKAAGQDVCSGVGVFETCWVKDGDKFNVNSSYLRSQASRNFSPITCIITRQVAGFNHGLYKAWTINLMTSLDTSKLNKMLRISESNAVPT